MKRVNIPIKATMTDKISFLLGLFFPKKQIIVETIITPPVTIGYCTDESTCISAITSIKFANLFAIPLKALTSSLNAEKRDSFLFLRKKNNKQASEITILQSAVNIE